MRIRTYGVVRGVMQNIRLLDFIIRLYVGFMALIIYIA